MERLFLNRIMTKDKKINISKKLIRKYGLYMNMNNRVEYPSLLRKIIIEDIQYISTTLGIRNFIDFNEISVAEIYKSIVINSNSIQLNIHNTVFTFGFSGNIDRRTLIKNLKFIFSQKDSKKKRRDNLMILRAKDLIEDIIYDAKDWYGDEDYFRYIIGQVNCRKDRRQIMPYILKVLRAGYLYNSSNFMLPTNYYSLNCNSKNYITEERYVFLDENDYEDWVFIYKVYDKKFKEITSFESEDRLYREQIELKLGY